MNLFFQPHPIAMAVTLLDMCGNDLRKAQELAELAVDPHCPNDSEFNFRIAVCEALSPKETANA